MVVNIDPDISSIENLVGIIQAHLAPFVREIKFNVFKGGHPRAPDKKWWDKEDDEDEEDEEAQEDDDDDNVQGNDQRGAQEEEDEEESSSVTLSPENTEYLRFLLAKLPNLKAVSIAATEAERGYAYEQRALVNRMFPQILYAVACLQDQKVVALTMPTEALDQLSSLLMLDQRQAIFRSFMQHLQHLSLITLTHQVQNKPVSLGHPVLNASPQLQFLKISDDLVIRGFQGPGVYQLRQLKAVNLSYISIDTYNLLDLLVRNKDTIKYVSFEHVILYDGTWLHILTQMRKNLKLLELYFMRESMDKYDDIVDGLYFFGYMPLPPVHIHLALGDLQRQINANRIEVGLEPFTTEIFEQLNLKPLSAVLPQYEWEILDSRTWDFIENF